MILGIQGGWAIDDNGNYNFPHGVYQQLDLMKQLGATTLRLNFRLGGYYTDWTTPGANGVTALSLYDKIVQKATSFGFNILGLASCETVPASQAEWVDHNAEVLAGNGDNLFIQAYASAVALLADHYKDVINRWEIWNEPNVWTQSSTPGVYTGGSYMYPSNFAWLLTRTYNQVRQAGLSVRLVLGGITSFDWDSGAQYLRSTYQQGITYAGWQSGGYPFDAIGQHIYIDQGGSTTASHLSNVLSQVRTAYVQFASASLSTEITEIGWQTSSVLPSVQAANLKLCYDTCAGLSYVRSFYWFSVQDVPESQLLFGLYAGDGSPKTVLSTYQGLAKITLPSAYAGNIKVALDNEWQALSDSPVPTTGEYRKIFADWLTFRLQKNKFLGPPMSLLRDNVDWSGFPIRVLYFSNARAELTPTTGKVRWWEADAEISL